MTNGKLALDINNGDAHFSLITDESIDSFESGIWSHIAISFNRSGLAAIFIDGEKIEATTGGDLAAIQSIQRAARLLIGAINPDGDQLSTGHYDALRLTTRFESGESIAVPLDDRILA